MRIVRYSYPDTRSFVPAFGFSGRSPWTGFETELSRYFDSAQPAFPVDLSEDKDNTVVRAELPGVAREDIAVELADGTLTITAARKQKSGETEESVSSSRSVEIPDGVQADKVTAAYENGVLTVTLPKSEAVKPRKITVS